jgi:hypothetical protein
MITLVTRPPSISFAGNPVRYALESDNFATSFGANASLIIDFDDIDETEGHVFELNTPSDSQVFTLRATDLEDGLSIPVAGHGEAIADWIAEISVALAKNYFLFNNYDIIPGSTTIQLDAKKTGSAFTLIFDSANVVGMDGGTHTDGADIGYRPGFGILLQVHGAGGDIIGEDFRSVDADGKATFNIAEYLQAMMEAFTPPNFHIAADVNNSSIHYDGVGVYFVSWCEKYIGTILAITPDNTLYSVMGGLSREALAWWNDWTTTFWEDTVNLMRFLTWCPRVKNTTTIQKERLFFMICDLDNLTLTPHIEVVYTDSTIRHYTLADIAMAGFGVAEMQVGYEELLLADIYPSGTVTSWSVWLQRDTVAVSEVFEFVLDVREREYDRQFIFRNSFGWYDTALLTGKVESALEYERTQGYTVLEEVETVYNAPDKAFSNKEQQTYKGSTGWLKQNSLDWLRDMCLSKEIYEVIGGRCYPVILTSKKIVKGKDMDDNLALDIEYRRAYNDVFYAPAGRGTMQSPPNYSDQYSEVYSEDYA